MVQLSNHIYCDPFIANLHLDNRILSNPYYDYPFLIIKNFLSEATLESVVAYVKESGDAKAAAVKAQAVEGVVVAEVDRSIRKTLIYRLPKLLQELYDKVFTSYQKSIEDYFAIALTTATKVQVLQYKEGFFYIKHADDSSEVVNEMQETVGFKLVAPERKLTSVLFATSYDEQRGDLTHFTGGALKFNYLFDAEGNPVVFKPEAGDMIIFPSNPIFSHEVLPVLSGNRITLVQWHNGITGSCLC